MPTARNTGHRLRLGTYAAASITSTYAISALTVQTDQKQDNQTVVEWFAPYQMPVPEYARVTINADGSASPDGFISGILGPFDYWTFGQISYFLTSFFPSSVYSSLVSMMLYDITDAAWYLNATLYRPVRNDQYQDYEPAVGGWANIRLRYGFGSTVT